MTVIDNVKARLAEVVGSLPQGAEIVPVYDQSQLIKAAVETLKTTLIEESVIVALVCIVFLLHLRSALVAILMLPVGILAAFAAMKYIGLGANMMSLGGIAIAVGAMIDAAIVMIENAHKHLERAPPDKPRVQVLIGAATEVGPALFFSLLVITVSFLPIFTLEAQEGRLFGPLAYTKTFAMAAAAMLSITLVPALMVLLVRGRIIPEHRNPGESNLDLGLPPDHQGGPSSQDSDDCPCGLGIGSDAVACPSTRNRVHARPERRHLDVHANDVAGAVGHQGGGAASAPRPDHQVVS